MTDDRTVLIAGAGCTGLTAALELARFGVRVRITDSRTAASAEPRVLALHPRTLDLLGQRGPGPELTRAGHWVTAAAVYGPSGRLGSACLARDQGRHGSVLLVPRTQAERILTEQLAQQGILIEHGTEVTAFSQPEPGHGVLTTLRHHDGRLEECTASYLIITGNSNSAAQPAAPPPGRTRHEQHWLLAAIGSDCALPPGEISVFTGSGGLMVLFPAGRDRYWLVATDPATLLAGSSDPSPEVLQRIIDWYSPEPIRLRRADWASQLLADRRPASNFRDGQVLFAGAAACRSSPATGQGANRGIQDAINLGWKLGFVLNGHAGPPLLATYAQERQPAIREIARRTESAAAALSSRSLLVRQLVNRVAPAFLDAHFVLRLGADLVREVRVGYPASALSDPPRARGDLQPGGWLPDIPVWACDEPGSGRPRHTRLHKLIDPSCCTLLLTAAGPTAAAPPGWDDQLRPWRDITLTHRITPPGENSAARARFALAFGRGRNYLIIRPDGYIAAAGPQHGRTLPAAWLSRWFPSEPGQDPPRGAYSRQALG